jgi:hypothetical protein
MNTKSIILAVLITLSTLFFGIINSVKAETTNSAQHVIQQRVEIVLINGVIWRIVYDADDNVIQASAVGHSE